MEKMTKREFFETVMAVEGIDAELKLFAEQEVAKMDERNAKRKNSPSKTAIANEPIKAEIVKVLSGEPIPASEIAEKVGVSAPKVTGLRNKLTEKFGVDIQKIIVDKRVVNGYCVKGE